MRVLALLALALAAPPIRGQRTPLLEPAARAEASSTDAEPTFAVDVEFRVYDAWGKAGRPLAGVEVELGAGRREDAPRWVDRPVQERVTSDGDGFVRATIAVPEAWRRADGALVWARVARPGLARSAEPQPLRRGDRDPTKLVAGPGTTLFGRVVDGTGTAVGGARVWLFDERWSSTRSDALGRFAVDAWSRGPHVLHTRASGVGSATREDLVLGPGAAPEPVELVLGGGCRLSGRVLDRAGAPVAGLRMLAVPAEADRFPLQRELASLEREGGLAADVAVTDRAGRFAFPALREAEYAVHGSWTLREGDGIGERELGERLARVELERGARPLELGLSRHRIEVRLLDHRGEEVALAAGDLDSRRRGRWLLEVEPSDAGRVLPDAAWERVRGRIADARVVFPVEPGREYVVSYQDPRFPYIESVVSVPPERHCVPVELRLGPPGDPARVTLRSLGPTGTDFLGATFRVTSTETDHELVSNAAPDFGPSFKPAWTVELPSGRLHVEADSYAIYGCEIPHPLPRAPFLPANAVLDVLPGTERTFDLVLGRAGHLDFASNVPGAGPAAVDPDLFVDPERGWIDSDLARVPLGGVRLGLYDRRGARVCGPLRFEVDGLPDWREIEWLAPGWPARGLTALPVGTWTLRAENERGVLLEREIAIEEGRTSVLRW